MREERPWGYYEVLAEQQGYQIKEIVVRPRQRFSLQRHRRRSEHWYVVSGFGVAVCGDRELKLGPGESVDLPRGTWHRMTNPRDTDLVFVELQTGDYFGEDDIVRLEDDYGRA